MKTRLWHKLSKNPFLIKENFGFDMKYAINKTCTYDKIINDCEMLKNIKKKKKKIITMTPVMLKQQQIII